jgi:hypothetical protein
MLASFERIFDLSIKIIAIHLSKKIASEYPIG